MAAQSIHRDATSVPTEKTVTTGFALQGSQTVLSYSLDSESFGKITSANFVGANGQIVAIDRSFYGQTKDIQQQFSVWQYNDLEGRKFTDGDQWGAAAYRFTPGKIEMDFELLTVDFAYKTWDTARDLWARNATSILGTAQAMGGISQIAGGIATCMGLVTCVAGFAVALHGLDDLVTGLDTAASGEFKQSYTNYGLLQSAQMAGFSEDTAKRIADTGEIGVGLLTGGLGDAARTVGKQAAKSSAMAVAKNVLQHTGTRLAVEGGITVGVGLGVGFATNSFENGLFAAQFGQIAGGIAADFSVACFTAGTPIVVDLDGNSRAIEELEVGDTVLARSEFDPDGPLELKRIEEKFVRTAAVLELVVRGRSIKTTAEHPFYVPAQGKFVAAGELKAGDELVSHTGELVRIDSISLLGEITTVYNLRVADHHTYFVGGGEWDFSIWAHNADYGSMSKAEYAAWIKNNTQRIKNNRTRAADLYEIKHTGKTNWRITSSGSQFDADGIKGGVIVDAKYIGKPARSPYIPGSDAPDFVRENTLAQERGQFSRMADIIHDPTTPYQSARIITNHADAVPYFETLMKEYAIAGVVVVKT